MDYYENVELSPELEEAAAEIVAEVMEAHESEEHELEAVRMEDEREELAAEIL